MQLAPHFQQHNLILAAFLPASYHFLTSKSCPTSAHTVTSRRRLCRAQLGAPNSSHSRSDSEIDESFTRRHNSRSSALLLRRLEPSKEDAVKSNKVRNLAGTREITRRTKRVDFPGSVDRRHFDSPLEAFIDGDRGDDGDSARVIRTAEMCRSLVADILSELLMGPKARFGKKYVANLVPLLGPFVDRVVVAAVSTKSSEEFAHSTFEARAKACIESCKVVPLVRWLEHNSLTRPQIGKVICMATVENFDESIRNLVHWLKTIYVKGEYLGRVMTKADGILVRSTDELESMVQFLEAHGLRREWMGFAVSRCPQLLSLSFDDLRSRVQFYEDMGMNQKDFGTMVFDYPKALGFFSLELMNVKADYIKEFGLNNEEIGRLLAFKPQLMGLSIEEKWKPLVKYLYYLGVQPDGMKRILTMKPAVFCLDLETIIAPKVRFFRDIGVREEALGHMIVKFPPLLTYSLHKKIRPAVIYLIAKAGVTQANIGKVIALEPELLGCSINDKLEVTVKYLLSLGIPLKFVGQMVTDFPMLLKYNLDILRPKYRYLRVTMVRPIQDLIEFPRFFSYSLEGRIIPRHKILVSNKVNFKLRHMLACTDDEFNLKVQSAVDRRLAFETYNNHGMKDEGDVQLLRDLDWVKNIDPPLFLAS